MWIKTIVLLCCVITVLAVDEHRPKKKDDSRGKRNLQYSISHHYSGPHNYRLERRISTGPQIPSLYHHSQFFPGPRSYSPYHKGRPYSLPPPPYAVQMEPLVHYSQRDPLYGTNVLSLNADGQNEDLLTDNNHLTEHVYGPPRQVIERPIYIKEPEPIIEIIIKESNVTLPPPPAPPTPAPKKKEQVQVFYVKYKKNPNGHGKDSIIYDKPVPAISPPVQDEHEEAPPQPYHHQEVVTSPPPPSTTLRTIIRPDSEIYHSPSGVKVTFGKESFDYDKRSNKPEDLKASAGDVRSVQLPQGRQLSSFPTSSERRPSNHNYNPPSTNFRQPQPYRPFSQFRQSLQRPQQYSTLPKQFQQTKTNQPFPPPRSIPPQFLRQPVPYQPFESLRQQPQPIQFRPQTHFPITQSPPITQKPAVFTQQFIQHGQPSRGQEAAKPQQQKPQYQPKQVQHQPQPQQQPQPQFKQQPVALQPQFKQQPVAPQPQFKQQPVAPQPQFQQQPQFKQQQFRQEPVAPHPQFEQQPQFKQPQFQQQPQYQQHPAPQPLQFQQQYQQPQFQQQSPQQPSIIPPGGELIHSLSKFEQHISVPSSLQSQHQPQPQLQQQSSHLSAAEYNEKIQQQFREANALQQSIQQSIPQQSLPQHAFPQQSFSQQSFPQQSFLQQSFPQQSSYEFQKSQQLSFGQTTSKPTTYSTTPSTTTTTTARTTTQEPEKPSTTTKDPKILNAQLPDEVPDELREQLLSSGILNNADISVLDYDKVGDIPLSALPPEQLANFYSAGGAQQIQAAGSAPIPSVVDRDGSAVDFEPEASEIHEVTVKPEVQMKVVHYDPQSDRGRQVQESYVKEDATQVEPVVLNDESYNRYLPLKVSGAQFPIPDVPELKGKKISSVVVLAPVAYDFSSARKARQVKEEEIELIEGGALKELLKEPSLLNFNKFLESENKTRSDKQAVILLVTGPSDGGEEKEIFMYDVATRSVSKLNGELSSAFVEAAEANSSDTKASASEIVETRVPYDRVPVIDPESDLETEASDHLERFVDVSGVAVEDDDLTAGARSDYDAAKTGRLPSP